MATVTITVNDALIPKLVQCFEEELGITPRAGVLRYLKGVYSAWRSRQAAEAVADATKIEIGGIT